MRPLARADRRPVHLAAAWVVCLTLLAGCGSDADAEPAGEALVGTFRLDPGRCTADGAQGSYFRMISAGGTLEDGGFFSNPDSDCPDRSFSVQTPGSDGGLRTGRYQPPDGAPFDADGNATASRITAPGSFTAIDFAVATDAVDPQSGTKVPAPEIRVDDDGRLSGQITAWTAAWNNLYFNQGAPKPGGGTPGLTTDGVEGTYDAATGRFVLTWVSTIVGGPFDRFSGAWHLEGVFEPAD